MKHILLLLIASLFSVFMHAQMDCNVRGVVTDCTDKEPLIGVVIMAESAFPSGVLTDVDGKFELKIPVDAKAIVVKYIGYKEQRIFIDKKQPCNIQLDLCLDPYDIDPMPWPPFIPPVIVEGFRNKRPIESTPASIGLIKRNLLESTDQTSLLNAVNTIPGVLMDQRGYGGSHRISIRGSAQRAPFAVRNVKMYLDGIPLTSPDGQTPLEMIDAFDLERLEVIKGPAGSVWGSGNGGALLLTSRRARPNESTYTTGVQVGSYDLYRTTNSLSLGLEKGGLRVSHVYQDNKGYRVQESNHKNQFSLLGDYHFNERNSFLFYTTYFNGNWGLPGGINASAADTLPTQANNYSWLNNANVWRERLMLGASHTHRFGTSNALRVTTAAYYYSTDKLNPYGTSAGNNGYKDEGADGAGGRMDWTYSKKLNNWQTKLNWGGEFQMEQYNITESSLLNGQPDAFKYLYDVNYTTGMAFASTDAAWKDILFINAGASLNNTTQKVNGYTGGSFLYDTTATWKSELLPRIALSARLYRKLYAYASLSFGNSNPTVFEMVDYENNFYNLSLKPEHGLNREVGLKYMSVSTDFFAEVNYYYFTLTDAIVSYQDTTVPSGFMPGDERFRYTNSGNTTQRGVEWNITKTFRIKSAKHSLRLWHSGSAFNYTFDDYVIDDAQLSGKKLAGVPLFNTSSGAAFTFRNKVNIQLIHFWMDKTPLNNDNTAWSNAYHLLNARASFDTPLGKAIVMNVYAGMNNITGTAYTSFFNLNAAITPNPKTTGRYFNPAPPINYYGGLSLTWKIGEDIIGKRKG